MRDDPRKSLQWLQEQLREEEEVQSSASFYESDDDDLLTRVDRLLEDEEEEAPVPVKKKKKRPTAGQRAEQAHYKNGVDENAAVFTKTKKQLRREARQKKKSNVNRKLADLVFLAVLEIIGILCILGWWLQ